MIDLVCVWYVGRYWSIVFISTILVHTLDLEVNVTDLEFSFLSFGLNVIKSLFLFNLLMNLFIFDMMIDTDPRFLLAPSLAMSIFSFFCIIIIFFKGFNYDSVTLKH